MEGIKSPGTWCNLRLDDDGWDSRTTNSSSKSSHDKRKFLFILFKGIYLSIDLYFTLSSYYAKGLVAAENISLLAGHSSNNKLKIKTS